MIEKHPGGLSMTKHLLELARLSPCRLLDMGAGDGQAVGMLQELGFDAVGIDLEVKTDHKNTSIIQGNFLETPFADESFDAVLSECAFYVSGNPREALKEAARLLKKGGRLLLADVSFEDIAAHQSSLEKAGFLVIQIEDITPLWKEYYIACIWNDTVDEVCAGIQKEKHKKWNYYLTVCERT